MSGGRELTEQGESWGVALTSNQLGRGVVRGPNSRCLFCTLPLEARNTASGQEESSRLGGFGASSEL